MIFKKNSNAVFPTSAGNNAEILRDFNQAIKALSALEVGAFSARETLNLPTYFDDAIDQLGIDPDGWAAKLEIARALAFGDSVDWDEAQGELESIADEHTARSAT